MSLAERDGKMQCISLLVTSTNSSDKADIPSRWRPLGDITDTISDHDYGSTECTYNDHDHDDNTPTDSSGLQVGHRCQRNDCSQRLVGQWLG